MARTPITVTSSKVVSIKPRAGVRHLIFQSAASSGSTVRYSRSPRLTTSNGLSLVAGAGKNLIGEPHDVQPPWYFIAEGAAATIEWDDGHDD